MTQQKEYYESFKKILLTAGLVFPLLVLSIGFSLVGRRINFGQKAAENPSPIPFCSCLAVKVYDKNWNPVGGEAIQTGRDYNFLALGGSQGDKQVKNRYRINKAVDSSWCRGDNQAVVDGWCEVTTKGFPANESEQFKKCNEEKSVSEMNRCFMENFNAAGFVKYRPALGPLAVEAQVKCQNSGWSVNNPCQINFPLTKD